MSAPDPFDELEELFAEDDSAPIRTPTRKEAQISSAIQRTPTRAEPLPVPKPNRSERSSDEAAAFRPTRRPPMAKLCIIDDGGDDGQWIRIREDSFVIGQTDGHIHIPHDSLVAPQHAEITRTLENGKWHWHLTDLHSSTGTFVAVPSRPLKFGTEMWLGSHRYRFEQNGGGQFPTICDVESPHRRFVLPPNSVVFGRRPAQHGGLADPDDPQLHPEHVRFEYDNDQWKVVDLTDKHGLWVRIDRVRFPVSCRFQLGEQRFLVRVLS